MKKLILGLLVVLFLVTLVYAETDTNLKEEIATTVKAEVETQVAKENSNKILQEYIAFCGGNEKLGKILYEEREYKASKANLLGQFVIWKDADDEVIFELALTGFYPSSSIIGLINHYYPNGIWIVNLKKEEIEHIPGPLVGVLKAFKDSYGGTRAWETFKGQFTPGEGHYECGINAYLEYDIFDEKHWYPLYSFVSEKYKLKSRLKIIGKHRKFGIIYNDSIFKDLTNTVFENEKSAQEFLDKYKAKKEKEKKKAIEKKEKEKKKQERKKARDKKWNEWFH
ncbi:MAG: hypothetical protein J5594_01410 [Elusimicrobiaceae bacterium]|nr:hypothetical protein [Elusimicrobiaceae bacterium]